MEISEKCGMEDGVIPETPGGYIDEICPWAEHPLLKGIFPMAIW